MNSNNLTTIIIGAGTGGLCLAHGLRKAGLAVRVFERDRTPSSRLFGYRLHIGPIGNHALEQCLPTQNFARLVATSAKSNTAVTFLDHELHRLLTIKHPEVDRASIVSERPIGRLNLRKVLLQGLDEVVQFGKSFAGYTETDDGRVSVRFEDGTSAVADVLVGADGAGSRVCRQLLPHARRLDTGIVVLSGKLPLDDQARARTPDGAFRGPTLIMGPRGCFMFLSAVEHPRELRNRGEDETQDQDYVMWGYSARRESLSEITDDSVSGDATREAVLRQMHDWDPALRWLIERADVNTFSRFAVKSAVPVSPWPTRRITLLGDALHNMTPYRGVGANMALRDAEALTRALVEVAHGKTRLLTALSRYEQEMIRTGFAAVKTSLSNMHRVHSTSAVEKAVRNTMFRVVDAVPMLQPMWR
jgi:2-polyprenyl-6-methoxyphenol hydroxylase-like FAD-dependent oxidoreductase